ncbi:MAG TPA: amidohydrolase family protein [Terriglobia bacterium]|nr:amidohydrolase family protein [Terriglobia bacterium]
MAGLVMDAQTLSVPIIDTHIHLFDPTRPQGVPWPEKADAVLFKPTLPDRYRKLTAGLNVVGAIEVECSPWLEDNQWVLDVAATDSTIVGMVGDLEPDKPEFPKQLERFHRNPLFLGIRYGNLWGRNLSVQLSRPAFMSGLRALAEAGLTLDTANPDPALIGSVVRITDQVPNLRVVIDHLPQLDPPTDPKVHHDLEANLHELGKRPQVYVKVSEVLRRVDGRVPHDADFYRDRLDELWNIFGPERLIYGSDWPNSDHWGSYTEVLSVVREYFTAKGRAAAEQYFWKNSIAAYRWVKRDASQPQLST